MVKGETLKSQSVEFAIWLTSNVRSEFPGQPDRWYIREHFGRGSWKHHNAGMKTTDQMYDYWLYHIKGRKAAYTPKRHYKQLTHARISD